MSWFWWLDKRLREVRATPHFTVATLPEVTIGRIVGVARALDGRTIQAPLSGRECVAYFAKVIGPSHSGDPVDNAIATAYASGSIELAVENVGVPFLLEDPTGIAIVDPDRAICALDVDYKSTANGLWRDLDAHQRAYLDRIKVKDSMLVGMKWAEAIVEVGERIAVVGYGQRVEGKLRMSSSPHLQLVICDNTATTGVTSSSA